MAAHPGDALAAAGNLEGATTQYALAVATKPTLAGAYDRLCHTLALTQRTSEALQCCRNALQLRPDQHFLHALEGEVASGANKLKRAAAAYRRACALAPSNFDSRTNAGVTLRLVGKLEEAASELRAATQLAPRAPSAYHELARALELHDPRAADAWRHVALLSPSSAEAFTEYGVALMASHRATEAAHAHRAALQLRPATMAAHFGLAQALRVEARPCEALHSFECAAWLAPRDADVPHAAGLAARACGRSSRSLSKQPDALYHFRAALALAPRRTDSLSLLRDAEVRSGPHSPHSPPPVVLPLSHADAAFLQVDRGWGDVAAADFDVADGGAHVDTASPAVDASALTVVARTSPLQEAASTCAEGMVEGAAEGGATAATAASPAPNDWQRAAHAAFELNGAVRLEDVLPHPHDHGARAPAERGDQGWRCAGDDGYDVRVPPPPPPRSLIALQARHRRGQPPLVGAAAVPLRHHLWRKRRREWR